MLTFTAQQHFGEGSMMKKYLCILAVLLFFVLNSGTSHACTGVYIGKEASADGTFMDIVFTQEFLSCF